jgi:hypothetical protein
MAGADDEHVIVIATRHAADSTTLRMWDRLQPVSSIFTASLDILSNLPLPISVGWC